MIGDPSHNLAEVRKEIEELTLSHGGTDLAATFEKVDEVLEASSISQKEVVFLTDLQAASWRPKAEVADRLKQLARPRRGPPGALGGDRPGKDRRREPGRDRSQAGVPVRSGGHDRADPRRCCTISAARRSDGVRVRLTVDGRLGPEESFDLQPGEDVPAVFPFQFSTPGDHLVEVSIDDDPLALDNRRYMVVPVRESLKVLLVDGHFKSEPYQAETDYLAQALSPTEESPGQPRPIRVEVIPESQLSNRELADFDVVVLCNVAQFSLPRGDRSGRLPEAGRGSRHLRRRSGCARQLQSAALSPTARGFCPPRSARAWATRPRRQGGFFFNPLGYRHPIVSEYQGESDPVTAGITQARTWQYHKLVLPKDTKAEVVMAFDNGDPAMVELQRQRGTVILVATSADAGWTDWPLHKSYLPIMQQIVMRASTGRFAERNIRVGQPFDQSFPASGAGAPVTVVTPKGQPVSTKLQALGRRQPVSLRADRAGGRVPGANRPAAVARIVVRRQPQPGRERSDQARPRGARRRRPGVEFPLSDELARARRGRQLGGPARRAASPLLYGLLALLLVESFLAWRFGHHE